ncbi:MAG TPA: PAS domain-containing protein [Candidatus Acidoferrum sp.]|nr:PAS domain-containing protein [Candidatus Acidoferrum sp.]
MYTMTMISLFKSRTWRILCIVASVVIFFSDAITPAGYVHSTLYIALLLMAAATRDNGFITLMTVLSVILTIFGATLGVHIQPVPIIVANRMTAILEQVLFACLFVIVNRQLHTIIETKRDLRVSQALLDAQRSQENSELLQSERAQALLEGSRHNFQQFANCIPQILWTAEPDGEVDFVNMAMVEYTGRRPEQLYPGNALFNSVHPADLPVCEETRLKSLRNGSSYTLELRLRHHDGAYRWHLAGAHPLRDENGHIYKWCGSAVDIHDIKTANAQPLPLAKTAT